MRPILFVVQFPWTLLKAGRFLHSKDTCQYLGFVEQQITFPYIPTTRQSVENTINIFFLQAYSTSSSVPLFYQDLQRCKMFA